MKHKVRYNEKCAEIFVYTTYEGKGGMLIPYGNKDAEIGQKQIEWDNNKRNTTCKFACRIDWD